MEHWFASADIIQNYTFSHIPDDYAKSPLLDIPPKAFIPDEHVIQLISKDYVFIVLQNLMKHMQFFRHYQHIANGWKRRLRTVDCNMNTKIVIVPMTIIFKINRVMQMLSRSWTVMKIILQISTEKVMQVLMKLKYILVVISWQERGCPGQNVYDSTQQQIKNGFFICHQYHLNFSICKCQFFQWSTPFCTTKTVENQEPCVLKKSNFEEHMQMERMLKITMPSARSLVAL